MKTEPFNIGSYVEPVCLPVQDDALTNTTDCFIAGWGYTEEYKLPKLLQSAKVEVFSPEYCEQNSGHSTNATDDDSFDPTRFLVKCMFCI